MRHLRTCHLHPDGDATPESIGQASDRYIMSLMCKRLEGHAQASAQDACMGRGAWVVTATYVNGAWACKREAAPPSLSLSRARVCVCVSGLTDGRARGGGAALDRGPPAHAPRALAHCAGVGHGGWVTSSCGAVHRRVAGVQVAVELIAPGAAVRRAREQAGKAVAQRGEGARRLSLAIFLIAAEGQHLSSSKQ